MFPAPAVEQMHARLKAVGDSMGVPFAPRDHAPSTKKALALSEFARRQGRLTEFRTLAMDAHWVEGRDIEDDTVLGELATQAGLDASEALAFIGSPDIPELLLAQRVEAQRWGVTGIPTWFLLPEGWSPEQGVPESGPRPVRVVGCQPMEQVVRAARIAGATERT